MLTSDLLITRNRKGQIYPQYIKNKYKSYYLDIIKTIISIFENHIGKSLDELDESLKSFYEPSMNKKLIDGFIKLLKDRCEFEVSADISPEEIRKELFITSSEYRKNLSVKDNFDRNLILEKVANKLGIKPQQVDNQMYADLKGSQIIKEFNSISPEGLFNRYNLSLAQAVLFKASKVNIKVRNANPKEYRELFRYIKFFRLIYTVSGNNEEGYNITLNGPFSLFKSVQKYGFQMALFLPALILLDDWELEAELVWGKKKQKATLKIDSKTGLVSHYKSNDISMLEECEVFLKQFKETDNNWTVSNNNEIINLKGEGICIPDFVFKHKETGDKIYMEVFGYWSRDTVWKRIELIEKNFPEKLILAVSKKLRISEKAVKEELPAQVYVYTNMILPNAITKILDELHNSTPSLF
ncbi:MAG: DUF790 family protein [Spirochaetota bacterium]